MNDKNKNETKFDTLDKTKINSEQYQKGNGSENGKEKQTFKEDVKPNYTDPLSGTAQTKFNKNRKIIIRNVPPVTYEVISCSNFVFLDSISQSFLSS